MSEAGCDCQTRSVSSPLSSSVRKRSSAPIQPSLSCTAVTPAAAATGSALRMCPRNSSRDGSA
jgi:hypothetical protein